MAIKTRAQLAAAIEVVRSTIGRGSNTRARVATLLQDIADSMVSDGERGIQLNSSQVTGLTAPPHLVKVANGVGALRARVENVYGDRSVAERLLDSLSPSKKVTVIKFGDSRGYDQSTEQPLTTHGYGVPWGGRRSIMGPLDIGAPWTNYTYGPTSAPVATPIDTYLGRYSPGGAYRSEMSAGQDSGGSNERCWYTNSSFNSAIELAQSPQMVGHTGKASLIVRKHSAGITNNKALFWVRGDAYTKPFYTFFSTMAATSQTARIDLATPAEFCATYPNVLIEVGGFGVQVAGESLDIIDVFFESDIGVTLINLSVGSRTIDHFLNDDIWSPALWADCIALYSGEKILHMSLGTNGCGLGAAEASAFKAKSLIAISEFRNAFPGGRVILDTAYASNLEPGWLPGRRRAYIDIAESTPGVFCADTQGELGHFEGMFAAGLYTAGDGVHANQLGRQYYARALCDLLVRGAA